MIFAAISNAVALWVTFSWEIVQNIPSQQEGQGDLRHVWPTEQEACPTDLLGQLSVCHLAKVKLKP